jgi:uncharacterized protein (DUF885 family)
MENITQLYKAVYQELLDIQKQANALAAQRQQSGAKLQAVQDNVRAQYAQKRQQLQEDLQTAEGFLTQTITLVNGSVPAVPPQQPDFIRMRKRSGLTYFIGTVRRAIVHDKPFKVPAGLTKQSFIT